MNFRDPSGLVIDTIADIGFVIYDLYAIVKDNIFGDEGNFGTNAGALTADAAAVFVPFATGGGIAVRGGVKVVKGADKGVDAVKVAKTKKPSVNKKKDQEEKQGGPHSETTKPVGDGKDSHHMPDRYADPSVDPKDGTAIKMDPKDHAKTRSNGRSREAQAYRAENKEMIKNGKKRAVYAREIKDVRRISKETSGDSRKYNEGIKEMLDYGKKNGQVPAKK